MPHQNDASNEAVLAARRAYRKRISQTFSNYSSLRALQTTALLHPGIGSYPNSSHDRTKRQPHSTEAANNHDSQQGPSSHTSSDASFLHHTLTTSASVASFETETSAQGDDIMGSSNRPSLVCFRDFPTMDVPQPGWQLHFIEDEAQSYVCLQEPDRYLHPQTLRRGEKEKALTWKAIIKIPARVKTKVRSIVENNYPDC